MNHPEQRNVCDDDLWVSDGSPTTSMLMFSAGVLGNAAALVLLEFRRRRRTQSALGQRSSGQLFQVLLTALLVTDLLGTCSVSPLVIAAYTRNESVRALSVDACQHFGFSMTYFSLVTLALLQCMALERCLSIAAPYFYERHLSARCGYLALALVYVSGALFCLAPFFNYSAYVQYCPGTWCFVDILSSQHAHLVYKNLYASCLLLMIACTVLCNVCVIYHLVIMYRRRELHRGSARRFRASTRSLAKELEHLVLLAFMTITFLICSLPLVIRVYISSFTDDHTLDLTALLLLSMNPILDPWVFILLSPPVPRLLWEAVCKVLRPRPLDNKVFLSVCTHTQTISVQT
ncbi:prostaglandin E2 receptor subtype EP2-like [Silurus asotus]|uniref:Prostaglandin E2 receptor subtype EP2-like n=1 Tax=Silurus asotus TaxID=30991 RepID=A0AAD5ACY1_SILAS|nr:prostaglandin E2 receptor subtype EP2-like [Silurus asotus]